MRELELLNSHHRNLGLLQWSQGATAQKGPVNTNYANEVPCQKNGASCRKTSCDKLFRIIALAESGQTIDGTRRMVKQIWLYIVLDERIGRLIYFQVVPSYTHWYPVITKANHQFSCQRLAQPKASCADSVIIWESSRDAKRRHLYSWNHLNIVET